MTVAAFSIIPFVVESESDLWPQDLFKTEAPNPLSPVGT